MIWSDYWGALSSRQRISFGLAAALIVAATIAVAVWLLRDPYVRLGSELSSEDLHELTRHLDQSKLSYRIDDGGDAVSVPASQLGKARAAASAGRLEASPSVGLELFEETDFSTSDFAQRINYQRALQGELTRTIRTMAGVRNARVHVILPEGGLFKRNAVRASAAVSVALDSGSELTRSQVRGIQRLVAASVPEIKIEDVVVLDESGSSLTRAAGDAEGDASSMQLELKRQVDLYLESKLSRLLEETVPRGVASLSVDTTLDYKQLRVTTEEPIAAGRTTEHGHAAGVLVKERQSQRGRATALLPADYASEPPADSDSTDWEYEYKVGHRVEQMLLAPGSIKRVSVAVALQGAPVELSSEQIEQFVAHAVGLDRSRGDSVAVLVLPAPVTSVTGERAIEVAPLDPVQKDHGGLLRLVRTAQDHSPRFVLWQTALAAVLAAAFIAVLCWARLRSRSQDGSNSPADIDAMVGKVRQWLSEGGNNGRP